MTPAWECGVKHSCCPFFQQVLGRVNNIQYSKTISVTIVGHSQNKTSLAYPTLNYFFCKEPGNVQCGGMPGFCIEGISGKWDCLCLLIATFWNLLPLNEHLSANVKNRVCLEANTSHFQFVRPCKLQSVDGGKCTASLAAWWVFNFNTFLCKPI